MPRPQHDPLAPQAVVGRRPWVTWLASAALAVLAIVSLARCGPSTAEGARRPVEAKWPSGVVRAVGEEVFHDGKWLKEGEFVFYDEDGDESDRGAYLHGRETGAWRQRYDDGSTGSGEFVDGKRHGPWTIWHKNGHKAEQGQYVEGERVGLWKRWSPADEPRSDLDYSKR